MAVSRNVERAGKVVVTDRPLAPKADLQVSIISKARLKAGLLDKKRRLVSRRGEASTTMTEVHQAAWRGTERNADLPTNHC